MWDAVRMDRFETRTSEQPFAGLIHQPIARIFPECNDGYKAWKGLRMCWQTTAGYFRVRYHRWPAG